MLTCQPTAATTLSLPYGTQMDEELNLRIFYVIVPSTQLNDVAIGSIVYRYTDTIGWGQSTLSGPYNITSHHHLGSCDRVGRGKISVDCFNSTTSNAIACRNLVTQTDWTKPGSGHSITENDHLLLRDRMEELRLGCS
ncbi:hypothetical protein ABHE73_004924 [Salmonella enterica]